MEEGPLAELLIERFEAMPPQLQIAARFILDHPQDVALISMREQAQRAGVSHTTMMRLARWLGLESYEEVRSLYSQVLRDKSYSSSPVAVRRKEGDPSYATVSIVVDALAGQVARLGEHVNATQLVAAASALLERRNLFSLGLRPEYPVAYHFANMMSQFGRPVTLLDAAGGRGVDALRGAGKGDAILAVSMKPYARATIEIARMASRQGLAVIAVTDSSVSPLARLAKESVIVTNNSQSFFKSIAPALAAVEILAALIAVKSGEDASEAVEKLERELAALDVYWRPKG